MLKFAIEREVGTSACSVRREHKSYNLTRIPRISQNIALNLCGIGAICVSKKPRTLHATSLPPTTHHSFLITHYSKCSSVLLSNLTTRNSSLIAHNSPLKIASTVYKTTNLPSDNQKVALSLGHSGRNRYFCTRNH